MVKHTSLRGSAAPGAHVRRGGKRVPLERDADRFPAVVSTAVQLSRVRSTPGVLRVAPVTGGVASVRTIPTDRDRAMDSLRSLSPPVVVDHAYRPRSMRGTLNCITDRIIVRMDPRATVRQVDAFPASRTIPPVAEAVNRKAAGHEG